MLVVMSVGSSDSDFFCSESEFIRDSTPIDLIMEQMYFQKCVWKKKC
jgi:hypothetical protein